MIIEFHSHVLPGVDDGSSSVEESIEMLHMEKQQGIQHVVATPHFYAHHDTPERFLARRDRAEQKLRSAMERYADMPTLSVGAEVYYFQGISDCDALFDLTIDRLGCILLEMPDSPWGESMFTEIDHIRSKQGILPIIAHIDRYIGPFRDYGIPKRLESLSVLVQANANFFIRKSTSAMALRMLRQGRIHILGSDCHNTSTRKPNLMDALAVINTKLGNSAIEEICMKQDEIMKRR